MLFTFVNTSSNSLNLLRLLLTLVYRIIEFLEHKSRTSRLVVAEKSIVLNIYQKLLTFLSVLCHYLFLSAAITTHKI